MSLAEQKLEHVLEDLLRNCSAVRHALRSWSRLTSNAELQALLAARARFYLLSMAQLKALRAEHIGARCIGPMLSPCSGPRRASLHCRLLMTGDQSVLNACEREEARVLMRYRDVLDFELPIAAEQLLRRQFSVMLDQHANLRRWRARVRPVEARVLALAP